MTAGERQLAMQAVVTKFQNLYVVYALCFLYIKKYF